VKLFNVTQAYLHQEHKPWVWSHFCD